MEASGRVGELGVREQERSRELEREGLHIGAVQGGAHQPPAAGLLAQLTGEKGRQDSGGLIQLSGLQMQLDVRPLRQGHTNVGVLGQVSGVQDVGGVVQQSGVQDVGVIEQQEESHVIRAQNQKKMAEFTPEQLESPLCPDSRPVTYGHQYTFLVNADTSAEAQDLETSIEEMLIRLDEFCAMMDMIRSETSLIIDDRIPEIERRAEEMSKIYRQVEKLEAFVKMVGHHVSFLEEELIRAERDHLSFPHTVKKLLTGDYLPTFLQKNSKSQSTYELPALYRTEDYFSASCKYKRNLN